MIQPAHSPAPHPTSQATRPTLIVIGGGNMGSAILRGNLASGLIPRDRVIVVEPDPAKAPALAPLAGTIVAAAADLPATDPRATLLLLGVKPQVFPGVASEFVSLRPRLEGALVASIMAGTPLERLRRDCPWAGTLVRLMPNLPAAVGRGITALCPGPGSTAADIAQVRALFTTVGSVIDLDESLIDAFTAVAGSGPAYVFLLAEAMSQGAHAAGFSREQADAIARATISGSAAMLDADPRDAATMRNAVTSRGGTTEAALQVLSSANWNGTMQQAILAARDRARQLAT